MSRVTKTAMLEGRISGGDKGVGDRQAERVQRSRAIAPDDSLRDRRSFIEQPDGSNSMEQLLSMVNRQTEIRFLISCGETKTLLRWRCGVRSVLPVDVMGSKEPLLTTIEQGVGYREGTICERVL